MSPKLNADFSEIVDKYKKEFPRAERDVLSRLIRAEKRIDDEGDIRKLRNHIAKRFTEEAKLKKRIRILQSQFDNQTAKLQESKESFKNIG
jgi:hypothetical protein